MIKDINFDNIDYLYIINNVIQMMEDRGYNYLETNYERIKSDILKIEENIKNNINNENMISDYTYLFKKRNGILFKKNKYILFLFLESFLNDENKNINSIYKEIFNHCTDHKYWNNLSKIYIICFDEYEEQINRNIKKEEFNILETIKYTKLLYNPTLHDYFPKHEKMKNYEKKYKKYNLKLPVILNNDVASKWYDFKTNDIIKVSRKDNSICYREVK